MAKRMRNADLGRATISPRRNVVVGTSHTFRIVYTAGRRGISKGGGIRILFPGSHSWSKAQTFHVSHMAGYVSALTDDGRCLVLAQNVSAGYGNDLGRVYDAKEVSGRQLGGNHSAVQVTVAKGRLRPGGRIFVAFGDIQNGKGFAAMASHKYVPCRRNLSTFRVSADADGSGRYVDLPEQPEVTLVPDRTVGFEVVAPSIVREHDGRIRLHVKAMDRFFNPTPAYCGDIELKMPDGKTLRQLFRRSRSGAARFEEKVPDRQGACRIEVWDSNGLKSAGNPFVVRPDSPFEICWGELHHHTSLSDDNERATRMSATPEETCAYARDVQGLDFVAVTDHHNWYKPWYHALIRRAWDEANECSAKLTRDGRFVVYPGMEYRCDRGDTNVICRDPGEAYCAPRVNSIRKVWDLYRGRPVLTIPHFHPQVGSKKDWSAREEDLERLVEVCSNHGRYEFPGNVPRRPALMDSPFNNVHALLAKGWRVGICCGSDDHQGQPGNLHLTAVLARGRTRAGIFDALRSRRCYGTTHARILMDFRVDGAWMGEEIEAAANAPRRVAGSVHGTAPLLSVEVVRNGREIHSIFNPGMSAEFDFRDRASSKGRGADWYYLRVLQADSEMAWTSPIWVTNGKER